jgi:predicted PurR-regulated permease PerM
MFLFWKHIVAHPVWAAFASTLLATFVSWLAESYSKRVFATAAEILHRTTNVSILLLTLPWIFLATFTAIIFYRRMDRGITLTESGDIIAALHHWWPKANSGVPPDITINLQQIEKIYKIKPGLASIHIDGVADHYGFTKIEGGSKYATYTFEMPKSFTTGINKR